MAVVTAVKGTIVMRTETKLTAAVFALTFALGITTAGPAAASHTKQDGLVNVVVGNVTIAEDINIVDAVDLVVQACGLNVGAIAGVLAKVTAVDATSQPATICKNNQGKVKVTQN